MKTANDIDAHSRSSSETHIPDLEKGEAIPQHEEQEAIEEQVGSAISQAAPSDIPLSTQRLPSLDIFKEFCNYELALPATCPSVLRNLEQNCRS